LTGVRRAAIARTAPIARTAAIARTAPIVALGESQALARHAPRDLQPLKAPWPIDRRATRLPVAAVATATATEGAAATATGAETRGGYNRVRSEVLSDSEQAEATREPREPIHRARRDPGGRGQP